MRFIAVLFVGSVGCADGLSLEDIGKLGDIEDIEGGNSPKADPVTGLWSGDCRIVAEDPTDIIPIIEPSLNLFDDDGVVTGQATLATFEEDGSPEETLDAEVTGEHNKDEVHLDLSADASTGALSFDLIVDGDLMTGRLDAQALDDGTDDPPHYDCTLSQG